MSKAWLCLNEKCNYIYRARTRPKACPLCGQTTNEKDLKKGTKIVAFDDGKQVAIVEPETKAEKWIRKGKEFLGLQTKPVITIKGKGK